MWVMDWRLANSLKTLRAQLNALYPARSKASDGAIGDDAHAVVKSEHNPNAAGVVTAIDITHDPANGVDMNRIAEALIASNDPRIWYIIFNKRIWEGDVWLPYSGGNPHDKHLHISVNQAASKYDDARQWNLNLGGESMTEEDAKEAYRAVLHREPENDAVWRAWVGKPFAQFSKTVRSSPEWLTQNHFIVHFKQNEQTIAELKKQAAGLSAPDKQKLEEAYAALGKVLKK